MLNTKFSPWPSFTPEEATAVQKVLMSNKVNYWTGTECREFEKEFAHWAEVKYAIALTNGTLALDLALRALGVGPGDEVIVTPRSFMASASCVTLLGATPVFADVDLNTQNISAETIQTKISKKTKAVIVVHLAGMPAEMDPIMQLASQHNFYVIEDCAQAHGALYKNRPIGSIGHIGAWSFCQDKIITTGGEGGMVTTNSEELWSKMWSFKDHGKSFKQVYKPNPSKGFQWVHESFGSNYRMIEIQAVIGRIQLKRLPEWSKRRRENAAALDLAAAKHSCLRTLKIPDHIVHAQYKHYIFLNPEHLSTDWTRDRIIDEINKRGVPCYHGSCPEIYLEKAFENKPYVPKEGLKNAKILGSTSLMFLVHPTLTPQEIKLTTDAIDAVGAEASKH